jgi:hypothetical protein
LTNDPTVSSGEPSPTHPRCPTCATPMWLMRIEQLPAAQQRQHFECQACGGKAVLPPLDAP